jgi:lysylphosphatidylglycerol synthetase-like protein (DUF2156 family)
MAEAARTFISYREPTRSGKTAKETLATLAVCGVAFAFCVREFQRSPDVPTVGAIVGLVVGIVALVVACSLIWSFAFARVHEVQVTDQGVTWDGKHWPWDRVTEIRSRSPVQASGSADNAIHLSIIVKPPRLRSALALPIEVRSEDPVATVNELRQFLDASGHSIRWR